MRPIERAGVTAAAAAIAGGTFFGAAQGIEGWAAAEQKIIETENECADLLVEQIGHEEVLMEWELPKSELDRGSYCDLLPIDGQELQEELSHAEASRDNAKYTLIGSTALGMASGAALAFGVSERRRRISDYRLSRPSLDS